MALEGYGTIKSIAPYLGKSQNEIVELLSELKAEELIMKDTKKSLPQLTAYGIMLKSLLDNFYRGNSSNIANIKCLAFDKEKGYCFNPSRIKNHIIPFLDYEKRVSGRKTEIKSEQSKSLLKDDFNLVLR